MKLPHHSRNPGNHAAWGSFFSTFNGRAVCLSPEGVNPTLESRVPLLSYSRRQVHPGPPALAAGEGLVVDPASLPTPRRKSPTLEVDSSAKFTSD